MYKHYSQSPINHRCTLDSTINMRKTHKLRKRDVHKYNVTTRSQARENIYIKEKL